jgi:hypothetical protein
MYLRVFERDVQSGQLRPSSVLMRSENLSATELDDMPAFRFIQRLAISPDQRHLYATLMMQNTIVTMETTRCFLKSGPVLDFQRGSSSYPERGPRSDPGATVCPPDIVIPLAGRWGGSRWDHGACRTRGDPGGGVPLPSNALCISCSSSGEGVLVFIPSVSQSTRSSLSFVDSYHVVSVGFSLSGT